jgi:hypothetical protein
MWDSMKGIDSRSAGVEKSKVWGRGWLLLLALLPACTNHGFQIGRSPASTFSQVVTSQTSGDFNLIQLTPDPISPGSLYALVGQNQEFEQYCNSGSSTCVCEYSYNQPGIGPQIVTVAPTYIESDMLRCPNQVPSGIDSFDIRINTVPTQTGGTVYHSNTIAYSLGGSGNVNGNSSIYLDLSKAESFVGVQRYQCRKREFIRNPLDADIIDPFQAMDPRIIYPFNFYTTNVSESLLQMQRGNAPTGSGGTSGGSQNDQAWECSLNATPDGNLHWWANPAVYSKSSCLNNFCSADAELIYPRTKLSIGPVPASTDVGWRRSTFSLAKRAYGVFQIPVIAAIAPRNYVSAIYSTAASPLGWAAKPIPATNGSSSCPAITLPTGARWVKLWNFRATSIPPAQVVTQSASANNSVIGCRPPKSFDSCQTAADGFSPAPHSNDFTRAAGALGLPLDENLPDGDFSTRVLMPTSGSTAAGACFAILKGMAPFTNSAAETWEMSRHKFNSDTPISMMKNYPWGVYSVPAPAPAIGSPCNGGSPTLEEWMSTSGNCATYPTLLPSPTPSEPKTNLLISPLSPDSYTDNLFVVTDPEVSDPLMQTNTPPEYTPVTFRAKASCMSGGNALASRSGCPNNTEFLGTEISWLNSRTEVNSPSITGPYVYPLCVVQFTQ